MPLKILLQGIPNCDQDHHRPSRAPEDNAKVAIQMRQKSSKANLVESQARVWMFL